MAKAILMAKSMADRDDDRALAEFRGFALVAWVMMGFRG